MKLLSLLLIVFCSGVAGQVQAQDLAQQNEIFWKTNSGHGITWDLTKESRLPHDDNLEMSGSLVSGIIGYKVSKTKQVEITRDIIFPQLRKYSKSNESMYRAYLRSQYMDEVLPVISLGEKKFETGVLDSVRIQGKISFHFKQRDGIQVVRTFFPSMDKRCFVEKWTLINNAQKAQSLTIGATEVIQNETGFHGQYHRKITTDAKPAVTINPGDQYSFGIYYSASLNEEPEPEKSLTDIERKRDLFLDSIAGNLVLRTPDKIINTLFYFSKIRAAESIFRSRLGLVHSPGGGNYYVGIWANDQAEYSGPFFSYLGYQTGMQAAMNAYRIFQSNMPKDGGKIWASFELDVTFPFGAHDRGDAAMIAYGATHFLLASGDRRKAEEIWPLIDWCLEYSKKRITAEGIVASESDELEGRFPTGSANLSTSSLYYGALIQAARLAKAMGKPQSLVADYNVRAKKMSQAIEQYFGAKMEGLDTYKYYKENSTLRAWICLPLVVGINQRKSGTLDALFDKLWSNNGVLTELKPSENGNQVFWDRGTLYAFRGAFKAGAADRALERLSSYSTMRLTGFRVPYAVEAWPENGMAHLSAESALYCRIFTEGILGLEPTGFDSFILRPNLPSKWDDLELNDIKAFGTTLDIELRREKTKVRLKVYQAKKMIINRLIENDAELKVVLK
ncbi:six-hairpin glycosidase-like protein [Pedobacter ginsengisoli]|uniref:six-hairpin glycosidase-like protein n=1 Tax=Pedobacter ginsengisoli TaxID=363852 RepID=UPI0025505C0F|nr:six-hairpin glycosidase-like protein [Pedobacter ginsengisoli]